MDGTADGVVFERWVRYGHDRLYVTSGGQKLGFWDNKASTLHPVGPADEPALRRAVDAYRMRTTPAMPTRMQPAEAAPVDDRTDHTGNHVAVPAQERAWTDLAQNRPGRAAREQAVAARDAAPVRSRLARVLGVHTDERAWRIGADGEEAVAERLARLPESWRVVHAVPVGERGSDIDHVVIGPGGVYTVNAKHHPGASVWVGGNVFLVNGQKQPYVRNSRHEAARASRKLSAVAGFPVHVTALIAVVGAHEGLTIRSQPPGDDVHVVRRKEIDRWLCQRGPVLDEARVDALFQAARRSTTWTG